MFLPTFDEAKAIVAANDAFVHTTTELAAHPGHRFHQFSYLLPGCMDFERPVESAPDLKAYELRGLVFVEGPDGALTRHLMLPKFFGLGQTTGCQVKDLKDKPILGCYDKRDGSLVRFVPVGGGLACKTKTSFDGWHCELAMAALTPAVRAFLDEAHAAGLAPIFELTGAEIAVVLPYAEENRLTLIAVRDEATGAVLDLASLEILKRHPDVPVVAGFDVAGMTLDTLLEWQRTKAGVEGWVVHFADMMVKVKTTWYEDMHDIRMDKNFSSKKLLTLALNETLDDALGFMPEGDPVRERAVAVEREVARWYNATVRGALDLAARFEGDPADKTAKGLFAKAHKDHPLFGLAMFHLANGDESRLADHIKGTARKAAKTEADAEAFLAAIPQTAPAARAYT